MSSRAQQKASARAKRHARERAAEATARRRRRLWQLGAAAFLALAVVVVAIAISQSGAGGGGSTEELADESSAVEELFRGVPQDGVALGDPDAPATLIEFVDLQCPFCAEYAREVLPAVVERYVRPGRVRLELRTLTFIGPDSERAAGVAAAAAQQDAMWPLVELFFRNQGPENSGYATDAFLRGVADETPGLDAGRALAARDGAAAQRLLAEARQAAARLRVTSTPSFLIARGGGPPRPLEIRALTADAFTDALDEALPTP